MGSLKIVGVNGREVEALVVELAGGLRVRFSADDWERMNLYRGQRVPVRLPGRQDVWLYLHEVVELPPIVWVVMVQRVRAGAGTARPVSRPRRAPSPR